MGSALTTLTDGTTGTTGTTGTAATTTSLVTTEQMTGLYSFSLASAAAVFAVLVTMVALYGLDVMSRANKLPTSTSRVSSASDEGQYFYQFDFYPQKSGFMSINKLKSVNIFSVLNLFLQSPYLLYFASEESIPSYQHTYRRSLQDLNSVSFILTLLGEINVSKGTKTLPNLITNTFISLGCSDTIKQWTIRLTGPWGNAMYKNIFGLEGPKIKISQTLEPLLLPLRPLKL